MKRTNACQVDQVVLHHEEITGTEDMNRIVSYDGGGVNSELIHDSSQTVDDDDDVGVGSHAPSHRKKMRIIKVDDTDDG